MHSHIRLFLLTLANRSVIIGTGPPENTVSAQAGALYMDDSGVSGAILYVKKVNNVTGDDKQGWVLV